jgi:hypothetical protein
MLQSVPRQTDSQRLPTGDHVKLLVKPATEGVPVNPRRWSHTGIMA